MKLSVIIPTYNEERVVGECISFLNKQTYPDVEIIVVDDGSTDGTLDILRALWDKINTLKILKQKHKGPGTARNLGASEARGDILVFADADMTFDRNFLKNLVRPIVSGREKGTFSKYEYVSNWNNVWARCWNINEGWEEKKRHPKNYPDTQSVFRAILKKEFNKVGGFDPMGGYMDDWTLSKKLGYEAVSAPGAIFYHKNPESLGEIFRQARWIGKRPYKLGLVGDFISLIRSSFPFSIIIGIFKSIFSGNLGFLVFKPVYDFGIFMGVIEKLFGGKLAK
jgi:glycosyltransferase involved in cell wall biosynthesis